MLHNLTESLAF